MRNARLLELFEVIQHALGKGPSIVELTIFVFQIDCLRLIELVIEQISVREIAIDDQCIIRRSSRALRDAAIDSRGFRLKS